MIRDMTHKIMGKYTESFQKKSKKDRKKIKSTIKIKNRELKERKTA